MNKNIHVVILMSCMAIFASGCVPLVIGAAVGAGGMAYVKGKVEKDFDLTTSKLHDVTLETLKELELMVRTDEVNVHSAIITFEFDDGKVGEARITANTEHISKLSVRVGRVGDEVKSRMILNAVQRSL